MKRTDDHMTMGLGIPSLLLIFVVLGMVILSTLTYLKEESNTKIVEKEIEHAREYYLADGKGRCIVETGDDSLADSVSIDRNGNGEVVKYIIKMNDKQILYIERTNNEITEYRIRDLEN